MDNYNSFYKSVVGFDPYSFQTKVADTLLNGKNVILSVPTGAGKTLASIMPFLFAQRNQISSFPKKMIYSLPLRTLANSIYGDISDLLKNVDNISIQTGEYSDDPYFEKDLIFSTIDQTLSNFLSFPLAISHGQANINAGSIIGSYLVFDEFHLLDPKLSMPTTLGMLRILKNLCRVCIMTATLSEEYINFLKKELIDFEVISINNYLDDVKKIKSLIPAANKNIKKSIHVIDAVLDTEKILEKHKDKTIVICNRVETAQRIFIELNNKNDKSAKIMCIHSRYFDSDRKQKEQDIKKYFGKHSEYHNIILVATQVIEAGMDISCDVMFTEISPINSFLQRAGRCARFENEYGDIYVCDVLNILEKEKINIDQETELDAKEIRRLNNKYLPYSKNLSVKSFDILKKFNSLDEKISSQLVNEVMTDEELIIANNISSKIYNIDRVRDAWVDCDKKHYRETIRDIQSIEIILFDIDSNMDKTIYPWQYETISVYKWSFIKWISDFLCKNDYDNWIIAKPIQRNDSQFDFDWNDNNDYCLKQLNIDELKNYNEVVFINNKYFCYNSAGLIVSKNDKNITSPFKQYFNKENNKISFKKDTFYEHNKALLNCYFSFFLPKMSFLFEQLNKYWGKEIDWDKLIKLVICFHDYGKLNILWQKPMIEYQRLKIDNEKYFEILAHSDYNEDSDIDLAIKCGINKKPSHAGIGAIKLYDLLYDDFDEKISRCAACAVLKHHNVETLQSEKFSIYEKFLKDIQKLLIELNIPYPLGEEKGNNDFLNDIIPINDKEWILYFIIVRILRICDQKATKSIEKYYTL